MTKRPCLYPVNLRSSVLLLRSQRWISCEARLTRTVFPSGERQSDVIEPASWIDLRSRPSYVNMMPSERRSPNVPQFLEGTKIILPDLLFVASHNKPIADSIDSEIRHACTGKRIKNVTFQVLKQTSARLVPGSTQNKPTTSTHPDIDVFVNASRYKTIAGRQPAAGCNGLRMCGHRCNAISCIQLPQLQRLITRAGQQL